MAFGRRARIHGIWLFATFVSGCSEEVTVIGEQYRSYDPSVDLVMIYDEETASMDIAVNIEQFRADEQNSVELRVDVVTPDGDKTRHDIDWTRGDGPMIPQVQIPVTETGTYEVVLSKLSIDGRAVDVSRVYRNMEILGVRSVDEPAAGCGPGDILHGTPGADQLEGTQGQDSIYGHEGADSIYGKQCGDILRGGKGNDNLWGGGGKDTLLGGEGHDVCRGGGGADKFHGCEVAQQDQ